MLGGLDDARVALRADREGVRAADALAAHAGRRPARRSPGRSGSPRPAWPSGTPDAAARPSMPAADQPWKTARFSVIAAARAARRRSSRSASLAPRWMSSISRAAHGERHPDLGVAAARGAARSAPRRAPPCGPRDVRRRARPTARSSRHPCGPDQSLSRRAASSGVSRSLGLRVDLFQARAGIGARSRSRWSADVMSWRCPFRLPMPERAVGTRAGPVVVGSQLGLDLVDVLLRVLVVDVRRPSSSGAGRGTRANSRPSARAGPAGRAARKSAMPSRSSSAMCSSLASRAAGDGRPPLLACRPAGGRRVHAVADVVVVADRVEGLLLGVLGAAREQLRVEDLLLGAACTSSLAASGSQTARRASGFAGSRPWRRRGARTARGTTRGGRGSGR